MRISDWSSDVCSSDLDFNRKALNLHHGVLITDEFMEAVRDGAEFNLRSPKDQSVRGTVDARSLFQKLVETRLATGEPYIIFIDQVTRMMPKHHRDLGLKVSTSNLCSEITLRSEERTSELQSLMRISYAVFCLQKKT